MSMHVYFASAGKENLIYCSSCLLLLSILFVLFCSILIHIFFTDRYTVYTECTSQLYL